MHNIRQDVIQTSYAQVVGVCVHGALEHDEDIGGEEGGDHEHDAPVLGEVTESDDGLFERGFFKPARTVPSWRMSVSGGTISEANSTEQHWTMMKIV